MFPVLPKTVLSMAAVSKVDDIILEVDDIKITRTNIITAKLNSLVDYQSGR
jgi:hypothetical protein